MDTAAKEYFPIRSSLPQLLYLLVHIYAEPKSTDNRRESDEKKSRLTAFYPFTYRTAYTCWMWKQ